MNFEQLMQKMRELDAPVAEQTVEECGEPMGMTPPMSPAMDDKPDTPAPTMSVNINAHGMDDISELMALLTKVNPDMLNQKDANPMPTLGAEPTIASIASTKPELPPLKMLPLDDIDEPEGDHPEPDADNMGGPSDGDADNEPEADSDSDDKEDKPEKEAFGNSPTGVSDVDYKGVDAAVPSGNDLNKPKKTFGPVAGGDNPMQRNESLQDSIKAELRKRLAEAKAK